jgi:hypothetical protein
MDRTCILILGMHRSGTSAICGLIHRLGADRPLRELPPAPDNERGFFEPSEIVAIHDRLLESAGLTWFDWDPLPQAWRASPRYLEFVDELAAAVSHDFPSKSPFLLKDPRICRFPDVWLAVLERMAVKPLVVHQYRDPGEVALSLKTRNGFPTGHGLLLWLRHIVDAERATRTTERRFISFSKLMEDWQSEIAPTLDHARIGLGKTSARAMAMAGDFLDPSLRHHVNTRPIPRQYLHGWVTRALTALERLRIDADDGEALADMDEVGKEFDFACDAFAPAFHQLSLKVSNLHGEMQRLPQLEAALASSQELVNAWTPIVERAPILEEEHGEALRALSAAKSEVDRIPTLTASLAEATTMVETLRPAADRALALETQVMSAQNRITVLEGALKSLEMEETERPNCSTVDTDRTFSCGEAPVTEERLPRNCESPIETRRAVRRDFALRPLDLTSAARQIDAT